MMIACILLVVAPAAGAVCPIDLLSTAGGILAWDGLQIGAPLGDVERKLGHPVELREDLEWPGRHSTLRVGDRTIHLTLHEADGVLRLSSLLIERVSSDGVGCWDRESMIEAFKRATPRARYLPSRHDPDTPESLNLFPIYALDDRDELIVMFKPSQGVIYIGELKNLD